MAAMDTKEFETVIQSIKDSTCGVILRLSCKKIDDAQATILAKALATNESVQVLDLNNNQIGDKGAQALAKALVTNKSVKVLCLGQNQIGDAGTQALAKTLTTNKTVQVLELYYNQIGDVGAQALAKALAINSTVWQIPLGHNKIGDEGIQTLAQALAANNTVQELDLGANVIGDVGAQALAKALVTNKTVQGLCLAHNQIGDKGAQALAEALTVNNTVQSLSLLHTGIGEAGAQVLLEMLQTNKTLHTLFILVNSIHEALKTAIDQALERNKALARQSARTASAASIATILAAHPHIAVPLPMPAPSPDAGVVANHSPAKAATPVSAQAKLETKQRDEQSLIASNNTLPVPNQTYLSANAGAGAGPGPDITTLAVTPAQLDFIKALQASGIDSQSLQRLQQQAAQTPFTAEEFQCYQTWKAEISQHMSTVTTQLMETQRKLGHDAKTVAEQAYIDSRPKLKAYQRRMEMEFSSFVTCYFLAPVGILRLEDNKKDLMISGINHIPKTVIAGIPLVGPLLSSGLGGVEAGMHFANKKYRLNQMNRVRELFRNPKHIAEVAYRFGLLLTLEKEKEIEEQVDVEYQGIAKIKGFYRIAKASLQKLAKDLPTSDTIGVKTSSAEELAILDCAYIFQQILSGETVIDKSQDLVLQLITVVTDEPHRARDLPVSEITPAAVALAPTVERPIAAITPIPIVGAGAGIEINAPVSPQVSPVNVAYADEVSDLRRQLAVQHEKLEKIQKQLPKPIEAEGGDQAFALATPKAAGAGATEQDNQFLYSLSEQLCIVREELNAVKECNARLVQERDFRQARERREAGHTALTLQNNALREKDKPQVGAGAAANAVTPQRPRRINGPADLV